MSRKRFILIAQAIRTTVTGKEEREAIARALIPALRQANDRFNVQKFLDAAVGR